MKTNSINVFNLNVVVAINKYDNVVTDEIKEKIDLKTLKEHHQ